jgi:N-formylglutamate amidohydrolase
MKSVFFPPHGLTPGGIWREHLAREEKAVAMASKGGEREKECAASRKDGEPQPFGILRPPNCGTGCGKGILASEESGRRGAAIDAGKTGGSFAPGRKGLNVPPPASPIIFASPHSGRHYPSALLAASRLSPLTLRSSEDAFVDELFAHICKQGMTLIKACYARAYVDLNRHPHELDPKLFSSPPPPFALTASKRVKSGLGVIPRKVGGGREIYKGPLEIDEALRRVRKIYHPYHGALGQLLNEAEEQFGFAILIDCHSMPSTTIQTYSRQSPDFVLGDRFGQSCNGDVTALARELLLDLGYEVKINNPYAGGYVTEKYGQPDMGRHVLQIEIRRGLYMDERKIRKNSQYESLRENLRKFTQSLARELPALKGKSRLAAE